MDIVTDKNNPHIIKSFNGQPISGSFTILDQESKYVFAVNKYQFASGVKKGDKVNWKYGYSSLGYNYDWDFAYDRAKQKHCQFIKNGGV